MTEKSETLMKQLQFLSAANATFLRQKQQVFTGQQRVLSILIREDGLIQSQLAEILDLRPSSLAELIKKLELAGDVHRIADEQDKRIKRVYLTEQGREKMTCQLTAHEEQSELFFAGLTEAEQHQFSQLMQKITDGWSAEFQQQARHFVDPVDRLEALQQFQKQMQERFNNATSREDMHKIREEIMKQRGYFGQIPWPRHNGGR